MSDDALNHLKRALDLIPAHAPAAVLMRHAERGQFARGHHGNDIPLTPQGERDVFAAGQLMTGRISRLLHSPVPRCLQTAEKLRQGGGAETAPREWLGLRCEAYVEDFDSALATLSRLVSEDGFYDRFINRMCTAGVEAPYPHFKPPLAGTVDLLGGMLTPARAGMCVGITHDWLVNVAAAYATGTVTTRPNYAGFLDSLFVWRQQQSWMFYYQGATGCCPPLFADSLAASRPVTPTTSPAVPR